MASLSSLREQYFNTSVMTSILQMHMEVFLSWKTPSASIRIPTEYVNFSEKRYEASDVEGL